MEHELEFGPAYSLLTVKLDAGESVRAESGAMVSMRGGVTMETKAAGGLMKGLKRAVLGGESFFQNTFTAATAGEATFAPTLPGDIVHLPLEGRTVYAQSGAYLVSTSDVDVDTKFGGGKTFFSGEGLFLLKISGQGSVWLSSYGGIKAYDLQPGERMTVDTGHIVAFSEGVGYDVRSVGGLKSTLFSGEGLVCEMTGPGRIWIQTRSEDSFLSWLMPNLKGSGGSEHGSGGILGRFLE